MDLKDVVLSKEEARRRLDKLAEEQGVKPVTDIRELMGKPYPDDWSDEEFLSWLDDIRGRRRHHGEGTGVNARCAMSEDKPDLDELLQQQGVKPIEDIAELKGDFWPENESVEEFLEFLADVRGKRRQEPAA